MKNNSPMDKIIMNLITKEQIMLIVNTENVPGRTVSEALGLVKGSTVQSKHVGRDIMAGLKTIVGGELRGYTELLEDARMKSMNRMIEQAEAMRADAIVNVRFTTSAITQGASEVLVYGTAVRL